MKGCRGTEDLECMEQGWGVCVLRGMCISCRRIMGFRGGSGGRTWEGESERSGGGRKEVSYDWYDVNKSVNILSRG
jgi:hypothetical protein